MSWTPPPGVTPIDRKPPSSPTFEDIPAVLDWCRIYYGGHTVLCMFITERATWTTYRIDGEPPYGTPGTTENYTLTPFGDSSAAQAARQAQADAQTALTAIRPIVDSDALLIMPRLDGTARLLYGPRLTATEGTYTLRDRSLKTITLTETP